MRLAGRRTACIVLFGVFVDAAAAATDLSEFSAVMLHFTGGKYNEHDLVHIFKEMQALEDDGDDRVEPDSFAQLCHKYDPTPPLRNNTTPSPPSPARRD